MEKKGRIENLTPFTATRRPKNPGRKKGRTMTDKLRLLLKKKVKIDDPIEGLKEVTGEEGVLLRLMYNALQGENNAIKEIFDRLEGKPLQKLLGEGIGDTRIVIIHPPGTQLGKANDGDRNKAVSVRLPKQSG